MSSSPAAQASLTRMPVGTTLASHLNPRSEEFEANRAAMAEMTAEVRALCDRVLGGGGERYVERHRARDKLLARERLEALVDPGTPVLELSPLAGVETNDPLGGGLVVALVEVSGTQCLVIANDPTVRGGRPARPPSPSCSGPWTWPRPTACRW